MTELTVGIADDTSHSLGLNKSFEGLGILFCMLEIGREIWRPCISNIHHIRICHVPSNYRHTTLRNAMARN